MRRARLQLPPLGGALQGDPLVSALGKPASLVEGGDQVADVFRRRDARAAGDWMAVRGGGLPAMPAVGGLFVGGHLAVAVGEPQQRCL